MERSTRRRKFDFFFFNIFLRVKPLLEGECDVMLKLFKLHLNYKSVIGLIPIQIWLMIATLLLKINLKLVGG